MSEEKTINVRLDSALKDHGTRVLNRCNFSPSELVRSVYRYMEKEQTIPPCLDIAEEKMSVYERRRAMLRDVVGTYDANLRLAARGSGAEGR